jgi:succinate dehydrogenase / fumarate reductase flavoprotein subunit
MKFASNIQEEVKTDVLIIGAGAAGVRTAIELAQHQINCLLLGKRSMEILIQ